MGAPFCAPSEFLCRFYVISALTRTMFRIEQGQWFEQALCIRANGNNRLGIRAQSFASTQTIVWAYANDNNPALNSLKGDTKFPGRTGFCTTSDALHTSSDKKKEM